jgi:hypothetical protein
MGGSQLGDGDRLALEVADRADALGPEELVAADVDPGQENDRRAGIHLHDEGRDERHADVDLAVGEGLVDRGRSELDVLHVAEPLGAQQLLGHVLGRDTDAGNLREPDPRRLGGGLGPDGRRA